MSTEDIPTKVYFLKTTSTWYADITSAAIHLTREKESDKDSRLCIKYTSLFIYEDM